MAASLCLGALIQGSPSLQFPPHPDEAQAAVQWLQSLNVPQPTSTEVLQALSTWQSWKASTDKARAANLKLELSRISPTNQAGPVQVDWDGRAHLQLLSQRNFARIKKKIAEKISLPARIVSPNQAYIDSICESIELQYLRLNTSKETAAYAPLPSARELAKVGLNYGPSFYSDLVGDAPSVAFTIVPVHTRARPYSVKAPPFNAIRLKPDLAEEIGFVLPRFKNPRALIDFFRFWDPELLPELFDRNRLSLPVRPMSPSEIDEYLTEARIQQVFPPKKAFERMAVLREHLADYVLTEPDARELLTWAFRRWLTEISFHDIFRFSDLVHKMALPVGPYGIFLHEFLPDIGLPDLLVRIPLVVGPESYELLRIENSRLDSAASSTQSPRLLGDWRKLDPDINP